MAADKAQRLTNAAFVNKFSKAGLFWRTSHTYNLGAERYVLSHSMAAFHIFYITAS